MTSEDTSSRLSKSLKTGLTGGNMTEQQDYAALTGRGVDSESILLPTPLISLGHRRRCWTGQFISPHQSSRPVEMSYNFCGTKIHRATLSRLRYSSEYQGRAEGTLNGDFAPKLPTDNPAILNKTP